jgi:hypothetical protein
MALATKTSVCSNSKWRRESFFKFIEFNVEEWIQLARNLILFLEEAELMVL